MRRRDGTSIRAKTALKYAGAIVAAVSLFVAITVITFPRRPLLLSRARRIAPASFLGRKGARKLSLLLAFGPRGYRLSASRNPELCHAPLVRGQQRVPYQCNYRRVSTDAGVYKDIYSSHSQFKSVVPASVGCKSAVEYSLLHITGWQIRSDYRNRRSSLFRSAGLCQQSQHDYCCGWLLRAYRQVETKRSKRVLGGGQPTLERMEI